MKVVVNSDVLYATFRLEDELPRPIEMLCEACSQRDVPIVLPETTVLEFDRAQRQQHVERERDDLRDAYRTLEQYGIAFDREDPDAVIQQADLQELMEATGATVEIVAASDEEFREAHRRACRHDPPHPPDTKASEMRDVIIWLIGLRTAREEGRAILLSQDEVHTGSYGAQEAEAAGLIRFDEVGKVLEALQVESPSGALTRSLLNPIWDDLVREGLPGGRPLELRGVDAPAFVRGEKGFKHADAWIRALGPRHGQEMTGRVELDLLNGAVIRAEVSSVQLDGEGREGATVEFDEPREVEIDLPDYDERFRALVEMMSGGTSGS